MAFFDTDNSVEETVARRAKAEEGMPVREATAADLGQTKPRAKREAIEQPAVKAEDAVAKRHGLYTADRGRTRTYFADYQQKREVMRADPSRIRTRNDDRQTVSAVLDLAQERGWMTLRLRGTEDFRREAWVQAKVRGMQTEGYKPTETDNQELSRRRAALTPVATETASTAPTIKAASPAAVWSDVQKAGETARAADVAKQGQGQGQQKAAKQKANGQSQPEAAAQQAA